MEAAAGRAGQDPGKVFKAMSCSVCNTSNDEAYLLCCCDAVWAKASSELLNEKTATLQLEGVLVISYPQNSRKLRSLNVAGYLRYAQPTLFDHRWN